MEKQTITIGQVRLTQDNDWYIVEESPKENIWQPLAKFRLGVDAIIYMKNYFDEAIRGWKAGKEPV